MRDEMHGQVRFGVGTLLISALLGCESSGGGGGGAGPSGNHVWAQPPTPSAPVPLGAVVEGRFRDAVVEGLDYDAGAPLIGTTGADGVFRFAQGDDVAFRVGGVPLGSGVGHTFMSPLSLTPAFISPAEQVDNRLRFLQMLDVDADPDNGILISNAVRAIAVNWGPLDFAAAHDIFGAAIGPLAVAANQADGVSSHAVPSVAAAHAHFDRTFVCSYSGLFRGTFVGGDRGVWTFVVFGTGEMFGGAVSNGGYGSAWTKTTPLVPTTVPTFQLAEDNGAVFTGDFRTPDLITGVWTHLPASGQFGGLRVAPFSDAALYRVNGVGTSVGTPILLSFEIDTANHVVGVLLDRDFEGSGEPVTLEGALAGVAFTAAAAGDRYTIDGTFDRTAPPAARQLAGTLHDNVKMRTVPLNLSACRLN